MLTFPSRMTTMFAFDDLEKAPVKPGWLRTVYASVMHREQRRCQGFSRDAD